MAAGDKEMRKAFEDVTRNNVKAAVAHGNESRKMFRELEEKVAQLDSMVRNQSNDIAAMRTQLATVQAIVFRGGTDGA